MAGKRGNHEGSIRKRSDGRWEARMSLDGGRRKSLFGKTRAEVAQRLRDALREVELGLPQTGAKQTVRQYLTEWVETVRPTLGKSSAHKYANYIRLHVLPTLGAVPLAKLTAQHLQRLYAAKLSAGLSPSTVNLIHKVLHRALADAFRLGLVQRNVSDLVDPPRRATHEMRPLSAEQARQLLATVQGDRLEALAVLALSTGMRQGELLALTWRNVDLTSASLQVQTTAKLVGGQLIVEETKTRRSRRRIALSPSAVEALRRHRARQLQERLVAGARWQAPAGRITTTSSRILSASLWTRAASGAGGSTTCSRGPGCRTSASTTCATPPPRSCCCRRCIRRW
jgi:integrase